MHVLLVHAIGFILPTSIMKYNISMLFVPVHKLCSRVNALEEGALNIVVLRVCMISKAGGSSGDDSPKQITTLLANEGRACTASTIALAVLAGSLTKLAK